MPKTSHVLQKSEPHSEMLGPEFPQQVTCSSLSCVISAHFLT